MAFKILGRDGTNLVTAGSSADHLSAEGRKIINLTDPTADQDAATKAYVDAAASEASEALDGTFRIKNTTDQTKEMAFDVSNVGASQTRTLIMPNANVDLALVATAIQSSEKGAANGVASLDANSKIPFAQIPAIAIVDTFVVADIAARDALTIGSGDGEVQQGDVAVVEDATDDVEVVAGGASYIYTGSAWQRLISPTDSVQSVNGQTAIVVLDSDDIAEGSTNLYYTSGRFDTSFAAKDTDDLAEGSTNLYFTEARVLASELAGYTVGSDVAIAETDTVLEAFGKAQAQITQAKADAAAAQSAADAVQSDFDDHLTAAGAHTAANISASQSNGLPQPDVQGNLDDHESRLDTAEAELISLDSRLDTAESDIAAAESAISALQTDSGAAFEAGLAGESFGTDQVWLVRRAKDGETAGRYYKAMADSAINSRVVGFIVVGATGLSAGDAIRVYKLGTAALGSSDASFITADLNTVVFLHQSTAGKWTLAPSQTAGQWIKEVGFVATTGSFELQPGMLVQA